MNTETQEQAAEASASAIVRRDGSATVVRREVDRKKQIRERLESFGGGSLKLKVFGDIPGYHLFWENDDNAAVEQKLAIGFEFVRANEVGMENKVVPDGDVTDRFSRFVGTKENGSPMRAYLLKCPDDIWAEIEAMGQEQADKWDGAIKDGAVQNVENRYKPKGAKIRLNNRASFRSSAADESEDD